MTTDTLMGVERAKIAKLPGWASRLIGNLEMKLREVRDEVNSVSTDPNRECSTEPGTILVQPSIGDSGRLAFKRTAPDRSEAVRFNLHDRGFITVAARHYSNDDVWLLNLNASGRMGEMLVVRPHSRNVIQCFPERHDARRRR